MLLDSIKAVLAPVIEGILRFIPDKNKRAEARELFDNNILKALTGLVQGQLDINQQEAKHPSIFVAGWRPFIGWVCGFALVWNFILQPLISWVVYMFAVFGLIEQEVMVAIAPPSLDSAELTTVLLGMLGLGGLRTYERRLGLERNNMNGTSFWGRGKVKE